MVYIDASILRMAGATKSQDEKTMPCDRKAGWVLGNKDVARAGEISACSAVVVYTLYR